MNDLLRSSSIKAALLGAAFSLGALAPSPVRADAPTATPAVGQLAKAGDLQVTLTALASAGDSLDASFLVQNMGKAPFTLKPLAQFSAKNGAGAALEAKDFLANGYRNGEVFLSTAFKKAGRMQYKVTGSGPITIAFQAAPGGETLTWKVELPAAAAPVAAPTPAPTPAPMENRLPPAAPAPAPTATLYKVGDRGPAGGTIFYDKGNASDGWQYLEAAPSDLSEGAPWGRSMDIKTATGVGTGKANTAAIIAAQGGGVYAAKLCADAKIGGMSDWFLPSKDELDLAYKALGKPGLGGFTFPQYSKKDYWTSSQLNGHLSQIQAFGDGTQTYQGRDNKLRVRPIRAF